MADRAVVVAWAEHYHNLRYEIIATTPYTSRDTWRRNYGTTAPLQAEVITRRDTSVGDTPAQLTA